MTTQVARAIDLGYGNVKYTRLERAKGVLECREFPSVAIPALSKDFDVKNVSTAKVETLVVEVNDRIYHVGPDAQALQQIAGGRELDPAYARGDRYTALMKAALAYIDEPVLDVLVLGLPLSTFVRENERLVDVWTRRHEVPNAHHAGQRKVVDVRRVIIVPQPIGAYMRALEVARGRLDAGNTLVIDPGFYTVDWVVMTPKRAILHGRSGALQGGVSALVRIAAAALERLVGRPIQNTAPIEAALRSGSSVFLYRREYQLAPCLPQIEAAVEDMVAELIARLGDHSDIRQVVIAGGGAPHFERALKAKLGDHVIVLEEPEFANLRGFQLIAESLARRLVAPAAA